MYNADFESFLKFKKYKSRIKHGCSLDILHFMNLMYAEKCAYSLNKFSKNKQNLSFERIDNSLGYIPGNVIAVSAISNSFRSDFTSTELMVMLKRNIEAIKRLEYHISVVKKSVNTGSIKELNAKLKVLKNKVSLYGALSKRVPQYENMSMLDKFKVYNGFNIDSEITKVIGVAINDFCIRAFCKGQGWISSTLHRARNTKSSILKS